MVFPLFIGLGLIHKVLKHKTFGHIIIPPRASHLEVNGGHNHKIEFHNPELSQMLKSYRPALRCQND